MHSVSSALSLASERLLEQLIEDDRFQQVEAETITEIGDLAPAILRQAEETQADLIVMGSKGKSGGRKLLGSTTIEVISKSIVPVLATPAESTYSGFEEILFMTDFHEGDLLAIEDMLSWANYFNIGLHILHIFTDESFQELIKYKGFKEVVKKCIQYEKLSFERIFNPSFNDGLRNYLERRYTDLITLTRYQKNFSQKPMRKDHTRKVGYEAQTPFLVLNGETYA